MRRRDGVGAGGRRVSGVPWLLGEGRRVVDMLGRLLEGLGRMVDVDHLGWLLLLPTRVGAETGDQAASAQCQTTRVAATAVVAAVERKAETHPVVIKRLNILPAVLFLKMDSNRRHFVFIISILSFERFCYRVRIS